MEHVIDFFCQNALSPATQAPKKLAFHIFENFGNLHLGAVGFDCMRVAFES